MSPNEKRLVEKAKYNSNAFGKLYTLYLDKIYKYIFFRVYNHTKAEDIVSDIFYKVLTNIRSFDQSKNIAFSTWIFTVAHNTLVDYYRKNSKTQMTSIDIEQEDLSDNYKNIEIKDLYDKAVLIIAKLPNRQQEVVILKYFSEMQNKEIAILLNISEKTVASNLVRGLRKIREEWE